MKQLKSLNQEPHCIGSKSYARATHEHVCVCVYVCILAFNLGWLHKIISKFCFCFICLCRSWIRAFLLHEQSLTSIHIRRKIMNIRMMLLGRYVYATNNLYILVNIYIVQFDNLWLTLLIIYYVAKLMCILQERMKELIPIDPAATSSITEGTVRWVPYDAYSQAMGDKCLNIHI